jgi:PQQ-like domain
VADELNIFDVSTETPTDSWAHGSAAAKAWATGSLRAEDGLDLSAEFDAQFSGKFGADMLKGIGSLSGDLTGAAHAGVRLQAGLPLDLFETAGIVARLRLEASANVRASVTAGMSVGEMRGLVTAALPAESRPYVNIVLDEIQIGATVWARASFAAMAISELVAAIDLFPKDGSGPGVTAYFHYGFGWGYGAGWGVITNVGFDLKRLLRRMSDQAELDLRAALKAFRTEKNLGPNDPLALETELAEVLLPLTIDALVSWCERELDSADEDAASLGESLGEAVRSLLTDAILPRLLSFAGEKVIENVAHVPPESADEIWGDLAAATVYLAGASDDPADAVGPAALVLVQIAGFLPADVGKPLGSAVRCAAAIVALASDSDDPGLRAVLSPTGADANEHRSVKALAGIVLGKELTTLLEDEHLIPNWVSPIFDSLAAVTATLTSDGSGSAMTSDEAAEVIHSLLTGLEEMMTHEGLWDRLAAETGFPAMVQSIKAQTRVVIELCASLKDGKAIDKHATREAVSVAIIMLIGQPLAQVISTVAERGLAEVPTGLRALADVVDQSSSPTSIDAGWEDLAKQVVGSSVGFPVAQLLRHAAGTAAQWRDTRLPAELALMRSFLEIDLADEFAAGNPTAAVKQFKKELLPILGMHVIDVVITSHEFILLDSINVFEQMVTGTVQNILRSLELSAIISFRLVEEAVEFAEKGVSELKRQEVLLEQEAERHTAEFFTALSDVTRHIRGLDSYVGAELTDWMVVQCMGPAAAAQMPSWIRDALHSIVTAAVNISSGGVLSALGVALGSIADLIDASAEALRLTASSPEGGVVGIQPLLEALAQADHLPSVEIPIGFDIPNPFMPFVLPSIHIEIARVPIPARALSSIVVTIIFGSTGLAPLIETLNATATSLRVTKAALKTVHDAISGASAQEMRQSLQAARPGAQLGIEVIEPLGAAVAPSEGTIAFRINGANLSFVDPAGAGLPHEAISRVQVMVNGQVVSVGDVDWKETDAGLEGRLEYGETDAVGRVMLRPGPAAVVVVVADGYGTLSAQQAWHFVVESPPEIQLELVVVPLWFPIAAGLTTPVPEIEQQVPVLGGPHRRLEAADLPVPEVTIERRARRRGGPPVRSDAWAQARPGVRVDEHREPELPGGYLHLERLSDDAAAWCTLDGRFGLVAWRAGEIRSWPTELEEPVQVLRASNDVIALDTATEARCFDAGSGELLWSNRLRKRRWQLLDATRDVLVLADGERVLACSPERGELWSVETSGGPVAARVSCDRLVVSEQGRVSVLGLAAGEDEWSEQTRGEIVVAGENVLVPGRGRTSHVYSLRESAVKKLKTSAPIDRPAPPGVRLLDGTIVPIVTDAGGIVLLDLAEASEADRSKAVTRPVERAWLAGPFLITTPPLSVAQLWGGIATPIPLTLDPATSAVVAGPAQALVRAAEQSAWLEFS